MYIFGWKRPSGEYKIVDYRFKKVAESLEPVRRNHTKTYYILQTVKVEAKVSAKVEALMKYNYCIIIINKDVLRIEL
jgi:hypothetical protein